MKISLTAKEVQVLRTVAYALNVQNHINDFLKRGGDRGHLYYDGSVDGSQEYSLREEIFVAWFKGLNHFVPVMLKAIPVVKNFFEMFSSLKPFIKEAQDKADEELEPYSWNDRMELFHDELSDSPIHTATIANGKLTIHDSEYYDIQMAIYGVKSIISRMPKFYEGSVLQETYRLLLVDLVNMRNSQK